MVNLEQKFNGAKVIERPANIERKNNIGDIIGVNSLFSLLYMPCVGAIVATIVTPPQQKQYGISKLDLAIMGASIGLPILGAIIGAYSSIKIDKNSQLSASSYNP